MMLHADLAVIIDRIRQIYAYEHNPTILVSRNIHARLKAISEHRPYAKRMRRKSPERMNSYWRARRRHFDLYAALDSLISSMAYKWRVDGTTVFFDREGA